MKVIVCGGRDYSNYELVSKVMDQICNEFFKGEVTTIIQGGARGADALGKRWALENNYPLEQFDAEWHKYGKVAGFKRNQEMLDDSGKNCIVVAFPGGNGTYDMVQRAKRAGVALYNIKDEEDELDREG